MDVKPGADRAQVDYANALTWGTRVGLALLVVSFVAYVFGFVGPHVPIADLPRLWSMPATELMAATHTSPGWAWAALLPRGDMLVLAAIAWLATCSTACLVLALRAFRAGGESVPAILCALEVVVILLAASGVLR